MKRILAHMLINYFPQMPTFAFAIDYTVSKKRWCGQF